MLKIWLFLCVILVLDTGIHLSNNHNANIFLNPFYFSFSKKRQKLCPKCERYLFKILTQKAKNKKLKIIGIIFQTVSFS